MTTELKPCPFCLRPLKRSSGKFNPMAACETDGCWMKEKQIAVPCDDSFSVKSWNTRAVPDVPELVRWKHCEYPNQHKMMEHTDGEYVLHSQAVEIIAAKDVKINEWEKADRVVAKALWEGKVKALEAELAQYKDQIPLGYITPKAQFSLLQEFSASDSISPVKMGECRVAIYDRPAPAADLKADLERKDAALRFYADTSKYPAPLTGGMGALWGDCGQIARAALNVEASNDKA